REYCIHSWRPDLAALVSNSATGAASGFAVFGLKDSDEHGSPLPQPHHLKKMGGTLGCTYDAIAASNVPMASPASQESVSRKETFTKKCKPRRRLNTKLPAVRCRNGRQANRGKEAEQTCYGTAGALNGWARPNSSVAPGCTSTSSPLRTTPAAAPMAAPFAAPSP